MTIADSFTPWTGLLGGVLIGLAAVILLLGSGRIAGISGIVAGLLAPRPGEFGWRLGFVASLIASAALATVLGLAPGEVDMQAQGWLVVVAGLLVGFGTRLGNGCTSGHGVCGIARGSGRSSVATVVFIGAAIITVAIVRHLI